ncbi:MAG: selenite/tellurite reduction operon c-type cytochrome lipoprotein ExtS [Deferribacterota bacterium]|nr:selenite/tellurite reduction operon c-type cytochrome lipoprotein ExtS [Deferribacterota bacterium]
MDIKILLIFFYFFILTPYLLSIEFCISCHNNINHFASKGDCTLCHRGNKYTKRKDIAHTKIIKGKFAYFLMDKSYPVFKGNTIIKNAGCRRCHTIKNKGNNIAANLDISLREKEIKEILNSIKEPNTFMPKFYFRDKEATYIINALLNGSFYGDGVKLSYLIVHFEENSIKSNPFNENCGSCHKVISKKSGPTGEGDIGPNLSGLFTKYFNNTIEIKKWNNKDLRRWIKNPRKLKDNALMPPIDINEGRVDEILEILK